jgi:DNA repair protein RadD
MTRDNGALTADILHTWQRLGDNRSTFCFAVDRDHARQLKEQFEAAGVPSAYMDAW